MSDTLHVWIDAETRSHCDLPSRGADNYATDPTTEIICFNYAFNDERLVRTWHPLEGEPIPDDLAAAADNGDAYFYASSARFDRLIWEYVAQQDHGAPPIHLERWRCTQFAARCNNLPSSLDNVTRCLRVKHRKNPKGTELIKRMSIPPYEYTPHLLSEMSDYCCDDILSMRDAYQCHREPTAEEWADYHANERINDRGVMIDIPLARAATQYAAAEEAELVERIVEVSKGAVTKARGEKLKAWALERLTEDQQKLLAVHKTVKEEDPETGEMKRVTHKRYSLDKIHRGRLLEEDDLAPDVREVLECSDFAQKSSVSKFKSMLLLADPEDSRVRGAFLANGAAQSGRYSSRGAQLHNYARDCMDDPEAVRAMMLAKVSADELRAAFGLPIMTILSRMLRASLIPGPGKALYAPDWSAIEGRVAPWLCDNRMGEKKLELYRASDADPEVDDVYVHAARGIYPRGTDIDANKRQVGKVAELSLQYEGGQAALRRMGLNYGVFFTKDEAEGVKERWRRNNPWCTAAWVRVQEAAYSAIRNPGVQYRAGRLNYIALPNVLNFELTLFCELPSGRLLTYPDAKLSWVEPPASWNSDDAILQLSAIHSTWTPKANDPEWPRSSLYGGILFQHATQASAADVLRWLFRIDDTDVIGHVHDEPLFELDLEAPEAEMTAIMEDMISGPEWAAGLPLKAEGELLQRYGK